MSRAAAAHIVDRLPDMETAVCDAPLFAKLAQYAIDRMIGEREIGASGCVEMLPWETELASFAVAQATNATVRCEALWNELMDGKSEEPPTSPTANPDPLLDFITNWTHLSEQAGHMRAEAALAFWRTHSSSYEFTAKDGPLPAATTAAGAIAALEKALSYEDMEAQDANLVRAALAYLQGLPA